uniref:Uncharacterized protein n=1 Tax=Thermosporothrix sp. COM3 TaxID=2490863 RepID=A0A455SHK2_9CHLR|nr:hypothetical protein KTC_19770 [Thermosporothrix sp. COM3]
MQAFKLLNKKLLRGMSWNNARLFLPFHAPVSASRPGSTPQELVFATDMRYTRNDISVSMIHDDPFRGNLVLPLFRAEVSVRRGKRVDRIVTEERGHVEAEKEHTNEGSRKPACDMAPEAAREPQLSELPSSRLRDLKKDLNENGETLRGENLPPLAFGDGDTSLDAKVFKISGADGGNDRPAGLTMEIIHETSKATHPDKGGFNFPIGVRNVRKKC